MVRWHHQLYGHEFEQASEVGDRLGSLMCSSPWGRKKQDATDVKKQYVRIVLEGKYIFKKELPEMSRIISFSKLKGNMETKANADQIWPKYPAEKK